MGGDEDWPSDSKDDGGSSSSYDSSDSGSSRSQSDSSSGSAWSSSYSYDDSDGGSGSSSSYDSDGGAPLAAGARIVDEWHAKFLGVVRNRRRRRGSSSVGGGGAMTTRSGRSDHADDVGVGMTYDGCTDEEYEEDDGSDRRRRRRSRPPSRWGGKFGRICALCFDALEHQCPKFLCNNSRRSTAVLLVAALLWLLVQANYGTNSDDRPSSAEGSNSGGPGGIMSDSFLFGLRTDRQREAEHALGSAAGDYRRKDRRADMNKKKKSGGGNPDRLPTGCDYPRVGWHRRYYVNCNELHEIDLRQGYNPRRRVGLDASAAAAAMGGGRAVGYVGSGLWRDVWKVDPRGEAGRRGKYRGGSDGDVDDDDDDDDYKDDDRVPPAVLKVMKMEHPYDLRNIDRHRRDALVMERLTSSDHVVDVYGYCGNSVLTEYVGRTLDDIIYKNDEDGGGEEGNHEDGGEEEAYDAAKSVSTRETPIGRILLALDVFRGIAAIHKLPGGPIIHADLQAKQFLIDRRSGTVKLNDFNRCRFMPRKVGDGGGRAVGQTCPLKIPQAPGVNRSPEEYNQLRVTEKIDVFSGGHVLYGILTGRRFWDSSSRKTIKSAIMKGQKPVIPEEFRRELTDRALADLIYRAYEFDARKRITAMEMVRELERLLDASQEEGDHNPSFRRKLLT